METICTDRKKNHVARRTLRAYSALSCEENREKIMSMDSGVVARGGKHTASLCPGPSAIVWFFNKSSHRMLG